MPVSIGTTTVTAIYLGTTSITSAYLGNTQVFGGSFTPLDLFSGGSQGIWLDPSDLTTMFSDRAGTTLVTTPGTVVGLRLDKSKGLVLGSELVVNGDFAAGTTGWTPQDGNVVLSTSGGAGVATYSATSTFYQAVSVQAGKTYRATAIIKRDSGSGTPFMNFRDGTTLGSNLLGQHNATGYTSTSYAAASAWFVAATTGTVYLHFPCSAAASTVVSIDNISVRELAGNHAVAPTDAARPIYGIEPKGGRRNLLTWSEGFDNAVWVKQAGTTVPTTNNTAPDGTLTADTVSTTSSTELSQASIPVLSGSSYAVSLSIRKTTGATVFPMLTLICGSATGQVILNTNSGVASVRAGFPGAANLNSVDQGDYWQLSFSVTSNGTSGGVYFIPAASTNGTSYTGGLSGSQVIWGAQLETGSTATAYQRVTTAYDVTESGVATCHYVQYDGSDDSLSTSAIDFTATDKMSVFAGVRKLSDGSYPTIIELSANSDGSNGAFLFAASRSNALQDYFFQSRGTSIGGTSSSVIAAPASNVIVGLADIVGDRATLRVNGAQSSQSTADQGTGNFGNYPLFIGRRNNAASPFNGRDYGLIVVGKAASATEITNTETWLAAKTSGVTL